MSHESQIRRESTHARIYKDHKKRVKKIALTRALNGEDNFSEINLLAEILEKELPKQERKLGIKTEN